MPTKTCNKCKQVKDLEVDFGVKSSNRDGRNRACKECHRGYTSNHYAENKSYYVAKARVRNDVQRDLLAGIVNAAKQIPCPDCGRTHPPCVMDFDHIRGKKTLDISVMVLRAVSEETLRLEMSKCEIVCSNCHRIRTFNRRTGANLSP